LEFLVGTSVKLVSVTDSKSVQTSFHGIESTQVVDTTEKVVVCDLP